MLKIERTGNLSYSADIDPKANTIEQVERVITGDLDFIDGEMTASAEAVASAHKVT